MVKLQGKVVFRGGVGTRHNYMSGWQNEGSSFMKYLDLRTPLDTEILNVSKTLQTELPSEHSG